MLHECVSLRQCTKLDEKTLTGSHVVHARAFGYTCRKLRPSNFREFLCTCKRIQSAARGMLLMRVQSRRFRPKDNDMVSPKITKAASLRRQLPRPISLGLCLTLLSIGTVSEAAPDATAASSNNGEPEPSKDQCVDWHKQSQLAQSEMKLVEARELARRCAAPTCPGLVVNDCDRWINDLDQRLPSVVFEVRVDGEPDTSATVTTDGKRVEEWTRGEALRLDPGEHQFRVELGDYQPIVRKVLLSEGMRFRVITIDFKSSSLKQAASVETVVPKPPSEPASGARRFHPAFFPLLGGGAAGIVSFGIFSLVGKSKQHSLEQSCKPNCAESDLKSMKTSYLIGDISLGLGLASLAAAGVFYFRADKQNTPSTTIGFVRLPGGGAAAATYRF